MWSAVVAEKEPFAVFHTLRRILGDGGAYALTRIRPEGKEGPLEADVLLAAGEVPPESRCRVAVIPGDGVPPPVRAAGGVVTYGLSQRNTLTISSSVDRDVALALQREILDVRGRRSERQEILLRRPAYLGLDQTMACVGGLLALGVEAGRIPGLLSGAGGGRQA